MENCSVCPQMERLFEELHQQGRVDELNIVDVNEDPEVAKRHNIRSVPYYLINGLAFNGLRSKGEILELLQASDVLALQSWIRAQLTEGQLDPVESAVIERDEARKALFALLADEKTELVVRIGLTAIIEVLASRRLFDDLDAEFIALVGHSEDRIAIDALYYLQLIGTERSMQKLEEVERSGREVLRAQARELLQESREEAVLH